MILPILNLRFLRMLPRIIQLLWPIGSRRDFKSFFLYIVLCKKIDTPILHSHCPLGLFKNIFHNSYLSPFEISRVPLFLKIKPWIPFTLECFVPSLAEKLVQWFWRRSKNIKSLRQHNNNERQGTNFDHKSSGAFGSGEL